MIRRWRESEMEPRQNNDIYKYPVAREPMAGTEQEVIGEQMQDLQSRRNCLYGMNLGGFRKGIDAA